MPQMFGTITVTDGISMGTEGMKYSLVSREVIADAIETAAQSQMMDGVLAVGAFTAGKMSKDDFECIERKALPGVGACGGMYTANTMSSSVEAVGMSLPYSSTMAAEDAEKRESAARSMEVLVAAIRKNIRPRDIVTRK